MWGPSRLRPAGSIVSEATITTATAIAAEYPSSWTCGMPPKKRQRREITTVLPANSTAPPEVATARATASL